MRRFLYLAFLLLFFLLASCGTTNTTSTAQAPLHSTSTSAGKSGVAGISLPSGFQMSIYAKGLDSPRFMAIGPQGALLVANRGAKTVVAFPAGSSQTQAGAPVVVASDLNDPTSLVMHEGYLYVGEGSSIARMTLGNDLKAGPIQRIITDLPQGGQHSTRTVLIGADNHIYVAIGSDCNVCIETDAHRAAVWIYNMDGSGGHLFAKGLRNAVGMAVNPYNKQVWVDVNGRDLMGDNTPPETLYALTNQGDYGWPRCHAGNIHDPDFGHTANACDGVQQPLENMQAHSAPLGMDFYPTNATQFSPNYRNSLYIAFHGSWNRAERTGYKVVRIPLHDGKVAGPAEDFATGWLGNDGSVSGRPTGLVFASDGTMFVSDDNTGNIYHIWYSA